MGNFQEVGLVTKEPICRRVGDRGTLVCTISLGIAPRSQKGGWCWVDVECWGGLAEKAQHFPKNSKIYVDGDLKLDSWDDPAGGVGANGKPKKCYKHLIKAYRVESIAQAPQAAQGYPPQNQGYPPQNQGYPPAQPMAREAQRWDNRNNGQDLSKDPWGQPDMDEPPF